MSALSRLSCLLAIGLAASIPAALAAGPVPRPPPQHAEDIPGSRAAIVAVVNGDVISRADVEDRAKLFAISTGMPMTPEILKRLTPQVIRQLIDERLRLQEVQKRKIVVTDAEIAAAIRQIETRNNMPPGMLRQKLEADGVSFRTLVDQLRVQIGWTRVLRQQLGEQTHVSEADVAARAAQIKARTGQDEYRVSEIFLPVDEPSHRAEAQAFADTIIQQLRKGAPFPVVAAQFSQSQTALDGGDLGWVDTSQLDPEVAAVVKVMPPGAISNPIDVPGGIVIATVRGKRVVGSDMQMMLDMRQVFLPFATPLDPAAPTEQQKQVLMRARQIATSAHSCDEMTAANKAAGEKRPSDPGPVPLDTVNPPAFRALLASLPDNKATQPLVSREGIAVMMVCSRGEKNLAAVNKDQLADQLVNERAEMASRQLQRDLRRRAVITLYPGNA